MHSGRSGRRWHPLSSVAVDHWPSFVGVQGHAGWAVWYVQTHMQRVHHIVPDIYSCSMPPCWASARTDHMALALFGLVWGRCTESMSESADTCYSDTKGRILHLGPQSKSSVLDSPVNIKGHCTSVVRAHCSRPSSATQFWEGNFAWRILETGL